MRNQNAGGAETEEQRVGGEEEASAANMFLPHGYGRPAQVLIVNHVRGQLTSRDIRSVGGQTHVVANNADF